MNIKAIGSKIISPIKKLKQIHLERKLARFEKKMAKMDAACDEFLLQNDPKLLEKREAVAAFLNKTRLKPLNLSYDKPNYTILSGEKAGNLIDRCGDNLEQIKDLYGDYGLAYYAKLSPKRLIKDAPKDIVETGYKEDLTISGSFSEYFVTNQRGSVADIEQRFGKAGSVMYKHFQKLGFVKTGISLENNAIQASYSTSPFGQEQISHRLNLEKLANASDNILQLLK